MPTSDQPVVEDPPCSGLVVKATARGTVTPAATATPETPTADRSGRHNIRPEGLTEHG